MSPATLHRYQAALDNDRPVTALRAAVQARLAAGTSPASAWAELDEFRADLEREGHVEQEDAVVEVMSMLEGWTQPYLDLSH